MAKNNIAILANSKSIGTVNIASTSTTYSYTWNKPAYGTYAITLGTTDNKANKYTFTQPSLSLEVQRYDTTFTVTVSDYKVQQDIIIYVDTGKTDATGTVDILFNTKVTKVTLTNGKAQLNVGKAAAGPYDVSATYNGDSKYKNVQKGTSFKVTKYDTTTALTLTNVNVGNAVHVTATVTSSAPFAVNGKIILVGAQGNKTITINNGQGTLDVTGLPAGRYVVSCTIKR